VENPHPHPPEDRDGISDDLIARARQGEAAAREELVEQAWQALRRYAHGRVPQRLRGSHDTEDILQSAIYRALGRLGTFELRGPRAFHGFLRRIVKNRIVDLTRTARATHPHEAPPEHLHGREPAPADVVDRADVREAYLDALERLTPLQRSAVVLRFELGSSFAAIATELGMPTAGAARMCAMRGAAQLRRALRQHAPRRPD